MNETPTASTSSEREEFYAHKNVRFVQRRSNRAIAQDALSVTDMQATRDKDGCGRVLEVVPMAVLLVAVANLE